MNLNKRDLKKVMSDFNSASSRLMNAHVDDYTDELKKFIKFVRSNDLINEIVIGCGNSKLDVEKEVNEVTQSYGESIFTKGETEEEEISNIYSILDYIAEKEIDIRYEIALGYANSRNYQDMINGFNHRFVLSLIQNIANRLKKIGFDMGMDENVKYSIVVEKGQVIIANDNATIFIDQYNGIDEARLSELIHSIREKAAELKTTEKDEVLDYLKLIEQELKSQSPKKGLVSRLVKGLQAINGTTQFAAAALSLYQFVQSLNIS